MHTPDWLVIFIPSPIPSRPATCDYSVYLGLAGPKGIVPLSNTAHDWSPAFRRVWQWLETTLRPAN